MMSSWIFKVIVAGAGGVGKTAMITRYCTGKFQEGYKMTIGAGFHTKSETLDTGEAVKMQLWDFAGEKRFRELLPDYCKGASGALIHVTCGPDLKLEEFDIIGKLVAENLSADAQVIIGARISKDFVGKVRVITIMTGVKSPYVLGKPIDEASLPVSKEISDLGIEVLR